MMLGARILEFQKSHRFPYRASIMTVLVTKWISWLDQQITLCSSDFSLVLTPD